jgi:hypothetical protein
MDRQCKHVAALLYALADAPDAFEQVALGDHHLSLLTAAHLEGSALPAEAKRLLINAIKAAPTLDQRLAQLDHAALLRLTSALARELDDGERWVRRWLDRAQGKRASIAPYLTQLNRALRAADHADFTRCLGAAITEIEALAEQGAIDDALKISDLLIDWINAGAEGSRVDDWELQEALSASGRYYIERLWGALIERAQVGRVAIAQHICEHVEDDGEAELCWGAATAALPLLARLMTPEERASLRALLDGAGLSDESSFARVMLILEDEAKTPAERAAQLWRYHQHGEALAMWLEQGQRDEALRRAATLERPWAHVALFQQRADHAAVIALLDKKIAHSVASSADLELWIDAKAATGQGAAAWEAGLVHLKRRPTLGLVAALERCAAPLKPAEEAEDAIAAALNGAPDVLLCWRLDRGELDNAALAWASRDVRQLVSVAVMARLADALEATHAATSAEALCALSEASLSEGKVVAYQEAAALAARARDLADRAQTRAAFDAWLAQTLGRYPTNNHVKKPFKDRGLLAR